VANAFYTKMKQKEREQYRDGVQGGMKMAFDLVAIALNHEFGFGKKRLERLEKKIQEFVNEIDIMDNPIVTRAHLAKALKQIRGNDFVR